MSPEKGRDTEAALKWVVGILNELKIPYQISGGFAARVYGSDRELNDIDIVMPNDRFQDLYEKTKEYVTFGPGRYSGKNWDLLLLTMTYEGQDIEIGGTEDIHLFDAPSGNWITAKEDISNSVHMTVFGTTIPVIPKESLIAYKRRLGREVDIADVNALEKHR